jgi:hypothetical protein
LGSNLAYAEIRFEESRKKSANELAHILQNSHTASHIREALSDYNICLKNPMWYVNLAENILQNHQIDIMNMLSSEIFKLILENYIKGSYCDLGWDINYQVYNIGSPPRGATNEQRMNTKAVSLFDQRNQVLCEIAKEAQVYHDDLLMEHCKNIDCIRIVATDDSEEYNNGIHKIPYPKLCAMVDSGEILSLERSVNSIS